MQAFKTANANLNKQKTQTTVSATTNQPSILPENKTHLRNERHDKDVDRECATCVVRLSGTLEDFQSGNPIVRIETETADAPGDISFKPDCHYPSTLCSGTLKGFLTGLHHKNQTCKVTNVQLTRFVNNTPVPVGVFISGVEDVPQHKLFVVGYDDVVENIKESFRSAFSPSTSVDAPASETKKKSSNLELKHTDPPSSFLKTEGESSTLLTPIYADFYGYSSPFSTCSGLSTHIDPLYGQSTKSDNKKSSTSAVTKPRSQRDADAQSQFHINKSVVFLRDGNGVLATTPWGSPLHVNILDGNVHATLKKHAELLKKQFKIPTVQVDDAISDSKKFKSKTVSLLESAETRNSKKPVTELNQVYDPAYNAFPVKTSDSDDNFSDTIFVKENFVGEYLPLVLSEKSVHSKDYPLLDPSKWENEGDVDEMWEMLKSDSVWKNAHRSWILSTDDTPFDAENGGVRILAYPKDMIVMYLACLFHDRLKSGDTDLRRFNALFVRLDSPSDWTAQGELKQDQWESVNSKCFSMEARLQVHYSRVTAKESSVGSSIWVANDDWSEDERSWDDSSSFSDSY